MTHYVEFLRSRYKTIGFHTGGIWVLIGVVILAPLVSLLVYPHERPLAWAFLIPGLSLIILGVVLRRALTRSSSQKGLTRQEGAVIVVLSWIPAFTVGIVPFMLVEGLTFTQALFESTSGWTTTGLSVVDVSQASNLILLYRSTMQLVGGAGFVILVLSALAGPAGTGLSTAEGRGDQLEPNVRRSASLVVRMYSAYVLVGIVALYLAGMDWFSAVNHAFCALSTGGFSTKVNSIGFWDSPSIEAVTIVLMLLGTTNFLTSYTLLQGKFRIAARNGESHLLALLWPLCALILLFGITIGFYPALGKSIRVAIFESLTAISTTGYSTVGYTEWHGLGWLVLLVLMLIGGGSGSTAGGIKQYRIYALYRSLVWEFRRLFLPEHVVTKPDVWQGERRHFLDDGRIRQISMFVFVYITFFLIGSLVMASYGYSLQESLFEFASTVGTVGLSVGVTSADAPTGLLLTQVVGMFLGRLEFFTVIVGGAKLLSDIRVLAI